MVQGWMQDCTAAGAASHHADLSTTTLPTSSSPVSPHGLVPPPQAAAWHCPLTVTSSMPLQPLTAAPCIAKVSGKVESIPGTKHADKVDWQHPPNPHTETSHCL